MSKCEFLYMYLYISVYKHSYAVCEIVRLMRMPVPLVMIIYIVDPHTENIFVRFKFFIIQRSASVQFTISWQFIIIRVEMSCLQLISVSSCSTSTCQTLVLLRSANCLCHLLVCGHPCSSQGSAVWLS